MSVPEVTVQEIGVLLILIEYLIYRVLGRGSDLGSRKLKHVGKDPDPNWERIEKLTVSRLSRPVLLSGNWMPSTVL